MIKSCRDFIKVFVGIALFCVALIGLEKSGIRNILTNSEALLSKELVNTSHLTQDKTQYDFGRVFMRGGIKQHKFKLINNSVEEVQLSKIYTSCKCLEVYLIKGNEKLGPFGSIVYTKTINGSLFLGRRDSAYVQVLFDPTKQGPFGVGLSEPFIIVEDGEGNRIYFRISALVFP